VPPHVAVWRSVRVHGETKTERSRRTLGLPAVAAQALRAWTASQAGERLAAGDNWQDTGLAFTNHRGPGKRQLIPADPASHHPKRPSVRHHQFRTLPNRNWWSGAGPAGRRTQIFQFWYLRSHRMTV
jgi:hypothetical protein